MAALYSIYSPNCWIFTCAVLLDSTVVCLVIFRGAGCGKYKGGVVLPFRYKVDNKYMIHVSTRMITRVRHVTSVIFSCNSIHYTIIRTLYTLSYNIPLYIHYIHYHTLCHYTYIIYIIIHYTIIHTLYHYTCIIYIIMHSTYIIYIISFDYYQFACGITQMVECSIITQVHARVLSYHPTSRVLKLSDKWYSSQPGNWW